MSRTLMIFGLGNLGGWSLEFLARRQGLDTIITADVNEEWGITKTNCAATGAGQEGYYKTIKFEKCDVNKVDETADLIKKYTPDVVYSCLTLSGWLQMRILPHVYGPKYHRATVINLPSNLLLLCKLMKAIQKSGVKPHVVNHSYPDLVNPVLCKAGLEVLVGAGNLDNIVAEIRRKISLSENVKIGDVTVYLIAEHALNVFGTKTGVPYFLKVLVGGKNLTNKFDADSLISDRLLSSLPDQGAWLNHPAIASSAVRNIMAIVNDTNELAHAPGPNGLPGGYPIRISASGVEIVLPQEVSISEAIRINTDGMRAEGVEEIKDDGTVVLTDDAHRIIREIYGSDLKEIPFSDVEDIAKELVRVFERLAERYKK